MLHEVPLCTDIISQNAGDTHLRGLGTRIFISRVHAADDSDAGILYLHQSLRVQTRSASIASDTEEIARSDRRRPAALCGALLRIRVRESLRRLGGQSRASRALSCRAW